MSLVGFIAGDMIGSTYEFPKEARVKTKDFKLFPEGSRFTDDTVMTLAVARTILAARDNCGHRIHPSSLSFVNAMTDLGKRYMECGYGKKFKEWLDKPKPYGSWGNGAAMRVGPIGLAYESEEDILALAQMSAEVSHDFRSAVVSAQAVAMAVKMARTGVPKGEIALRIEKKFKYTLRDPKEIRKNYGFEVMASRSVPEAISCFIYSDSVEDAIRNAVSLGGDSDTQASMAGGIALSYFKEIPKQIHEKVYDLLTEDLRKILEAFDKEHGVKYRVI